MDYDESRGHRLVLTKTELKATFFDLTCRNKTKEMLLHYLNHVNIFRVNHLIPQVLEEKPIFPY